jgi:hypothetical protein
MEWRERLGEVRHVGNIENTPTAIAKLARRISRLSSSCMKPGPAATMFSGSWRRSASPAESARHPLRRASHAIESRTTDVMRSPWLAFTVLANLRTCGFLTLRTKLYVASSARATLSARTCVGPGSGFRPSSFAATFGTKANHGAIGIECGFVIAGLLILLNRSLSRLTSTADNA